MIDLLEGITTLHNKGITYISLIEMIDLLEGITTRSYPRCSVDVKYTIEMIDLLEGITTESLRKAYAGKANQLK